ncbi:thiamine pyrophosphate-binding protein [Neomicrococcus lactis]|uniref:thiamine pyrophosphate-binding protein n=1 Tax=Neomicrococcus lactis TaxID=732241 RepID=UPI0023004E27|nr:thiamine pyrophosphate-binding protein [Neomicrococcus lactis]
MISVSEAIAQTLAQHVDAFFGLMGNGNAYFVDALERIGQPIIEVRHEVATVASADAYYRVSGKLAVATTTYGAGYTNTLTALAEAAQAGIPMVLVVGDEPGTGRRPWDVDQRGLAESVGARFLTVTREDAVRVTGEALTVAWDERVPVVLSIPYDIPAATYSGTETPQHELPAAAPKPSLNEAQAADIARQLLLADRPLILAGRGAKQARAELRALAGHLGAGVATSAPARGLFNVEQSSDTFLDLGVCGGFAAEQSAAEIHSADLVLVAGAGLNQFTRALGHAFSPKATLIQIDLKNEATHESVTNFYSSDASLAATAILSHTRRLTNESHTATLEARREAAASYSKTNELTQRDPGQELAPDGRLDPRGLMVQLNEALPRERTVIVDGGHFIGWPNTYLDLPDADHMVMVGTAFQSIGLGFPSAAGAVIGRPDSLPVLFCGDGGGLMGIADAETFIRLTQRGVVVVINDGAYGAEVHQYVSKGLAERPVLIPDVNFAGMLEALGARSAIIRRHSDLADFERWLALDEDGVFVLDCRVSKDIVAPYMREFM